MNVGFKSRQKGFASLTLVILIQILKCMIQGTGIK